MVSIYLSFVVVLSGKIKKVFLACPNQWAYFVEVGCNFLFNLYLGLMMVQKGFFCICAEPNLPWHIIPNCSTMYWDPFGSHCVCFGTQRAHWMAKMLFLCWKLSKRVHFVTKVSQNAVFLSLFDAQHKGCDSFWPILTLCLRILKCKKNIQILFFRSKKVIRGPLCTYWKSNWFFFTSNNLWAL